MINLKKTNLLAVGLFTGFALTSFVNNASAVTADGPLGATSTGTKDISVDIGQLVQITNIAPLAFGTYVTGNFDDADEVCIHSNNSLMNYSITASGDGAGSAFTLSDGTNAIPYLVVWNGAASGTFAGGDALSTTVKSATYVGSNVVGCGGSDNATLNIRINDGDMSSAAGGTYSGVLTLLVQPE